MAHEFHWPEKQEHSPSFLDWVSVPKLFCIFLAFFLASVWMSFPAYVPLFPLWARISAWVVSLVLTLLVLSLGQDRLSQMRTFKKLLIGLVFIPVFLAASLAVLSLANAWTSEEPASSATGSVQAVSPTSFLGKTGLEPGVCVVLSQIQTQEVLLPFPETVGPFCYATQTMPEQNARISFQLRRGGLGFLWVSGVGQH